MHCPSLRVIYYYKYACAFFQKVKTPWLKMLTSPAVWAIIAANVTSDWGIYTMLTNIPTYMYEVLKFDMTSVSMIYLIRVHYMTFSYCILVMDFIFH